MTTAIEITRETLDAGKIVHTGWTLGRDVAEQCGVNVTDYFDRHGEFLGADDNGLAPTFDDAIQARVECEVKYQVRDAQGRLEASFATELEAMEYFNYKILRNRKMSVHRVTYHGPKPVVGKRSGTSEQIASRGL